MSVEGLIHILSTTPAVTHFHYASGPRPDTQIIAVAQARPEDLVVSPENGACALVQPWVRDETSLGRFERHLFRWGAKSGRWQQFARGLSETMSLAKVGDADFEWQDSDCGILQVSQPQPADLDLSFITAAANSIVDYASSFSVDRVIMPPLGLPHLELDRAAKLLIKSLATFWSLDIISPPEFVIASTDETIYRAYVDALNDTTGGPPQEARHILAMIEEHIKMADRTTVDILAGQITQHRAAGTNYAEVALFELLRHPDPQVANYASEILDKSIQAGRRVSNLMRSLPRDQNQLKQDLEAAHQAGDENQLFELINWLLHDFSKQTVVDLMNSPHAIVRYYTLMRLLSASSKEATATFWGSYKEVIFQDLLSSDQETVEFAVRCLDIFAWQEVGEAYLKLMILSEDEEFPAAHVAQYHLGQLESSAVRAFFEKLNRN